MLYLKHNLQSELILIDFTVPLKHASGCPDPTPFLGSLSNPRNVFH